MSQNSRKWQNLNYWRQSVRNISRVQPFMFISLPLLFPSLHSFPPVPFPLGSGLLKFSQGVRGSTLRTSAGSGAICSDQLCFWCRECKPGCRCPKPGKNKPGFWVLVSGLEFTFAKNSIEIFNFSVEFLRGSFETSRPRFCEAGFGCGNPQRSTPMLKLLTQVIPMHHVRETALSGLMSSVIKFVLTPGERASTRNWRR